MARTRPGRPPKPLGVQVRGNLTIRLRDRVRADLEDAACKTGRSLSEEIEHRLEADLLHKNEMEAIWGSREIYGIAALVAALFHEAILPELKSDPRARILLSKDAYGQALIGTLRLLERLDPDQNRALPKPGARMKEALLILASGAVNDAVGVLKNDPAHFDPVSIKQDLGYIPKNSDLEEG